jgi:DNA-binding CsgD family transcriptional regulator
VEAHIRHVFHKLAVSSRVEIARAIERNDRREP